MERYSLYGCCSEWIPSSKLSFNCVKYTFERDCDWDQQVCSIAASHGQLECVKYLCEKGCFPYASIYGPINDPDILSYLGDLC